MSHSPAPNDWLLGRQFSNLVARVSRLLRPAGSGSPFTRVPRRFFIACTSRTGSFYLSQRLDEYGADVQEYLNLARIEEAAATLGVSTLEEYCEHLVDRCSPGGSFGVKGATYALVPLFLVSEFPEQLEQWKFVYLKRENLVRQAISLHIAQVTSAWMASMPAEREVADSDYNAEKIAKLMRSILVQQDNWELFFAAFGLRPLRITYEQLVSVPDQTLQQVADFVGLSRESALPAGYRTTQQSTELNLEWENRFMRDARAFHPVTNPNEKSP